MRYLIIFLLLCSCGIYADPADLEDPHYIIQLPPITVHLVEDCFGYSGLAWIYDNQICVESRFWADGDVDPLDITLGHEVQHIMHMYDKRVVNPDD